MHPVSMRVIKLALERLLEDPHSLTPAYITAAKFELAKFTDWIEDHEKRRNSYRRPQQEGQS